MMTRFSMIVLTGFFFGSPANATTCYFLKDTPCGHASTTPSCSAQICDVEYVGTLPGQPPAAVYSCPAGASEARGTGQDYRTAHTDATGKPANSGGTGITTSTSWVKCVEVRNCAAGACNNGKCQSANVPWLPTAASKQHHVKLIGFTCPNVEVVGLEGE